MTKLVEMQRNFISDCLSGKLTENNTLMAADIETHALSAQGLMGIYQNSAVANITATLSNTYPVIKKLVGEEFFHASCRQFILGSWPTSGNMDDYGAEFPDFLAEFEHAKHLTYLKDVASLEWAFHQSSLAADSKVTDWSTLAQVANVLQIKFLLAPSFRFMLSVFPVDKIWLLNQDNTPPDIEANFESEVDIQDIFLILFRRELKTVILSISHGEYIFLNAFYNGQTFEQAITAATETQPDISIDESLKKFIELGVICGFDEKYNLR